MKLPTNTNDILEITSLNSPRNGEKIVWVDLISEREWTRIFGLLNNYIRKGEHWMILELAEFINVIDPHRLPERVFDTDVIHYLTTSAWGAQGGLSFVLMASILRRLYGLSDAELRMTSEFKDSLLSKVPREHHHTAEASYWCNMTTLLPNSSILQEAIHANWDKIRISTAQKNIDHPAERLWELANARLIMPARFHELADAAEIFSDLERYMNHVRKSQANMLDTPSSYSAVLQAVAGLKILHSPLVEIGENGQVVFENDVAQNSSGIPQQLDY